MTKSGGISPCPIPGENSIWTLRPSSYALTGRHGGLSPSIVGADDVARVDLIALDEFVEGFAAKHLRAKGKNAMEINRADVAELVDARDLKSGAISVSTWFS